MKLKIYNHTDVQMRTFKTDTLKTDTNANKGHN